MLASLLISIVCASIFLAHVQAVSFSHSNVVGRIDDPELDEASGIAASRKFQDVLYTHNDHGDRPRLFAINATSAQVLVTLEISPAKHDDWEDIAVGPCGPGDESTRSCIYILDDGEHGDGHGDARIIYKVPEPGDLIDQTLAPEKLVYNWTEHGADSLMVDPTGELYVISTVHGSRGMIVHVPSSAFGTDTPVYVDSGSYFAMESSHTGPLAADISPDGTEVLVKNYNNLYYYSVHDGDYLTALTHQGINLPYHKENLGQAVCWSADASSYYTIGEADAARLYQYMRVNDPTIIG